jgi:hypothetical protein
VHIRGVTGGGHIEGGIAVLVQRVRNVRGEERRAVSLILRSQDERVSGRARRGRGGCSEDREKMRRMAAPFGLDLRR